MGYVAKEKPAKAADIRVPLECRAAVLDRVITCLGGSASFDETRAPEFLKVASSVTGDVITVADLRARLAQCQPWRTKVKRLLLSPGIEQRTPAWHDARKGLITASDVAQALGCSKFGNQRAFFQKKCGAPEEQTAFDASLPPLKWGVMYEPVAQALYSAVNAGVPVYEFGLLLHPTVPHLGASPDGITDHGVMLEIKCPWRRRIDDGNVPLQYYHQIQIQLEVCGLEECDYFECEFFEVDGPDEPEWSGAPNATSRGVFVELETRSGGSGGSNGVSSSSFVYATLELGAPEYQQWLAGVQSAGDSMGVTARVHWWVLRKRCTARVMHDPAFVADVIARTGEVWQQVLAYRADRGLYEREVLAAGASKRATSTSSSVPSASSSVPSAPSASSSVPSASSTKPGRSAPSASRRPAASVVDVYAFISDDEGSCANI
jgi:putative phage-type endonuclease